MIDEIQACREVISKKVIENELLKSRLFSAEVMVKDVINKLMIIADNIEIKKINHDKEKPNDL